MLKNSEVVARISTQLRMLNKDDYTSKRFIIKTAENIALKFITQTITRRSLDRQSSMYREIECIDFEPIDTTLCNVPDFRDCRELSISVKKFPNLIFTRYGSSIKELYSIDRSHIFTSSTLSEFRNSQQRRNDFEKEDFFYIINDHIYVPARIKKLSALILMQDQYELDIIAGLDICEGYFDKLFIAPDSLLEDIIAFSIQQISTIKSIPEDEKDNLSSNDK